MMRKHREPKAIKVPKDYQELIAMDNYFRPIFEHLDNNEQVITVTGKYVWINEDRYASPGTIRIELGTFKNKEGVQYHKDEVERGFRYHRNDYNNGVWLPKESFKEASYEVDLPKEAEARFMKRLLSEGAETGMTYSIDIEARFMYNRGSRWHTPREYISDNNSTTLVSPQDLYLRHRKMLVYVSLPGGDTLKRLRELQKALFAPNLRGKYVADKKAFFLDWLYHLPVTNNVFRSINSIADLKEHLGVNALSLLERV